MNMVVYIRKNTLRTATSPRDTKQCELKAKDSLQEVSICQITGHLAFVKIFHHIKAKRWEDSPECFPFLHVRNAVPAPGWFHLQEKCLSRQQLAGFPLFTKIYQTNSDQKIKIEFPREFTQLARSFEAELDITEDKTKMMNDLANLFGSDLDKGINQTAR